MIRDEVAENDSSIVVLNIERAVVLGESFVEPKRHGRAHGVLDQQMDILVKDCPEWLIVGSSLGRQGDVIDVFARLKITGNIRIDLERFIRAVALKDDD